MREQYRCEVCGELFVRCKATKVLCDRCAKKASKKREAARRKEREAELQRTAKKRRCPFCGTVFKGHTVYCRECLNAGFDNVHKMFGSTNGWDKKKYGKVAIKDGWRGRGVIGSAAVGFGRVGN